MTTLCLRREDWRRTRQIARRWVVPRRHERQPPAVQTRRQARQGAVAGKLSDDLPPGTLNSILKQAGLKKGVN